MKQLRFLVALLLAVSCNVKEIPEADVPIMGYGECYASIESALSTVSKAYADEQLRVLWHADDRISVFGKYTYNQEYAFAGETGDNAGVFNKIDNGDVVAGNALPGVWAVYPYQSTTSISNDGVLSISFPVVQSYAQNSFGRGAGVMVSATEDNHLLFKNAGGMLVFKLYGSDVSVKSLTLKGNNGEKISGKAKVTMEVGGTPAVVMDENAGMELTLRCDEAVTIGSSADTYTEFWMVLPPTEFTKGFTVEVSGPGGVFEKSTTNPVSITRNHLSRMAPIEVTLTSGSAIDSISDVFAVSNDTDVDFVAYVCAKGSRSAVLTDGVDFITIYAGTSGVACTVGDRVRVKGTKVLYREVPEITSPEIEVLSSGNELPEIVFQDITDSFDSFTSPYVKPVALTGKFQYKNEGVNNNLVMVSGASTLAYLYWPLANLFNASMLNDRTVLLKGFYLFDQAGQHSILPVSVECIDEAQPSCEIWYTSTNGQIVAPNKVDAFGVNIVSNTYEDGKGVLRFEGAVTQISYAAFRNCTSLSSITLPQSLSIIGQDAFENCTALTTIHIPESVTDISFYAFMGCTSLASFSGKFVANDSRSLIIGDELVALASAGLTTYTVPDGVSTVYSGVFVDCPDLSIIVYPETVSYAGQVFSCKKLEAIVFKSATPPAFYQDTWIGTDFHLFTDTNNCPIFVPASSVDIYKNADKWSEYEKRIKAIPNTIGLILTDTPDNCPVSLDALVCATGSRGFVVTDGDGSFILVYTTQVNCAVGDHLHIEGIKATYRGVAEITSTGLQYSVIDSGNPLPDILFDDVTSTFDNFSVSAPVPLQFIGVVNGVNMTVEGAQKTAYLYWPDPSLNLSAYEGKKVLVKGIYLFDNGQEREFMPMSIGEVKDLVVPESVDMGLSVKWATFNVGATAPEGYGDYFAWGETEPKSDYDWPSYKFELGSDYSGPFSKYVTDSSFGTVDHKTVLDPEDDAAHVNWGGSWRIPTKAELEELISRCTWTRTTQNGVNGQLVTGPSGKSIFFPATGGWYANSLSPSGIGNSGNYWSATIETGAPNGVSHIQLGPLCYPCNGCLGFSIRPVEGAIVPVESISVQASLAMYTGRTASLAVTMQPYNATYKNVSWESSDKAIVTVDAEGNIKALAEGSATITVYSADGSKSAACEVTVTTLPQLYGHEYVDLGLSVKWAACDVGASNLDGYGDYFAWGETESKEVYDWSTYKWCNGSYNTLTKYNNHISYGTVDDKVVLELEDDAAHANWGGSWRMPTFSELRELHDNCTWTWTSDYNGTGVAGRIVTSKITGYTDKSVFFPASGFRDGTDLVHFNDLGSHWSSTVSTPSYVHYLAFTSGFFIVDFEHYRYYGHTVRPVSP